GVRQGLRPGRPHGLARQAGDGHGCVVDHAVTDHLDDVGVQRHGVGGDGGELPGELLLAGQALGGAVGADLVDLHLGGSSPAPRGGGRCVWRQRRYDGAARRWPTRQAPPYSSSSGKGTKSGSSAWTSSSGSSDTTSRSA